MTLLTWFVKWPIVTPLIYFGRIRKICLYNDIQAASGLIYLDEAANICCWDCMGGVIEWRRGLVDLIEWVSKL